MFHKSFNMLDIMYLSWEKQLALQDEVSDQIEANGMPSHIICSLESRINLSSYSKYRFHFVMISKVDQLFQ